MTGRATSVGRLIPPGDLNDLLVNGVIAGVGAVMVFLPQILLLFLFIGLLEDTGYMARAAFLMDRLMSKVGLHGKSFIPMLSSFACAIPGIMATRTIETPKDRLVTILVAPLMSCSARLPVYTLLIARVHSRHQSSWLAETARADDAGDVSAGHRRGAADGVAVQENAAQRRNADAHHGIAALQTTAVAGGAAAHVGPLEAFPAARRHGDSGHQHSALVPGDLSADGNVNRAIESIGNRKRLQRRPTSNAPIAALDNELAGEQLRHSFAGRMGQCIEPVIAPLGFDWKMGIGIISSFAAREVFVSTMSTVYNVGGADESESGKQALAQTLRDAKTAGRTPVYTPLTAITLMVFYVFALQCVSTVAMVRRETNSWKWPMFQWVYMGALAWVLAFITWHGGHWLGWRLRQC